MLCDGLHAPLASGIESENENESDCLLGCVNAIGVSRDGDCCCSRGATWIVTIDACPSIDRGRRGDRDLRDRVRQKRESSSVAAAAVAAREVDLCARREDDEREHARRRLVLRCPLLCSASVECGVRERSAALCGGGGRR